MSQYAATRFRSLATGILRIASGERGTAPRMRCPAMSAKDCTARHVFAGSTRCRVSADPTAAFGLLL